MIRKALVNGLAVGASSGVLATRFGADTWHTWQFWVVMLAFVAVIVNMEFS